MTRLDHLDSDALLALLSGRRWFPAIGLSPESARVSHLVHADRELEIALVDVGFAGNVWRTYVLAVGQGCEEAIEHPPALARLAELAGVTTTCKSTRVIGVEQSNSSAVLDESFVLKLYRRVETGPSPEVELLRALEESGFSSAPRVRGVIEYSRDELVATLAVVTDFVPSSGGGWELALASLASGDADWLPTRARRLGEVTGSMHAALAAASGPGVAAASAGYGSISSLARTVDQEIVGLVGTPIGNGYPRFAISWAAFPAPRHRRSCCGATATTTSGRFSGPIRKTGS